MTWRRHHQYWCSRCGFYRIDPVPESTLKNIRAVSSKIWNTNRELWLRSLSVALMTRGFPSSPRTTLLTGAASLIAPTYLLRLKKINKWKDIAVKEESYTWITPENYTSSALDTARWACRGKKLLSHDQSWYLICWKTGGLSLTSPTWTMTVVLASTPAMLRACTTRK